MTGNILHQTSWAKTALETKIELYESKFNNLNSKPILFIGGVHGDEPEGIQLAEDLLRWLQKNNKINLQPWLLIPCLNIDGYKANMRTNAQGVDLNRNFPSPDWILSKEKNRYYSGPTPNSEFETKALVELILLRKPKLIVHFHSWEPCVVYTGKQGRPAADIIGKNTPYQIKEEIGYPTPGSLGQYGWLCHQTPVICIEAQEKSSLDTIWPIFGSGLIGLLNSKDIFEEQAVNGEQ